MYRFLWALVLFLAIPSISSAAEITASTCNFTDVSTAINAATDGDTVKIPAGTCVWSNLLTVTKQLYIIGNGIDSTIITDNNTTTGTWTLSGNNLMRLAHMTINGTHNSFNGTLKLSGNNKRVDHIKFNFSGATGDRHAIRANGTVTNVVIDHCHFTGSTRGINVFGTTTYWTDNSQYAPGTNTGFYIEDNTFDKRGVEVLDMTYGSAYVARYNTVTNGANFAMHGADSGTRSGGYVEIYNNTFTNPGSNLDLSMVFRGGSQIIYNNTITGLWNNTMKLQNWRTSYGFTTGLNFHPDNQNRCEHNSVNPLDGDVSPQDNGWPCKDQIGRGPNQSSKPSYEWNNTKNGGDADFSLHHLGGTDPVLADHVQDGRDFFGDTTMPGYTAFEYPHPLIAETEGEPPATEELIAYWPLNDGVGSSVADDNTENANDGTLTGFNVSTAWQGGKLAGALAFDGVDDYVEVPDDPVLDFAAGQDFTVLTWIRTTTALTVSTNPSIIHKMSTDHTLGWEIVRASTSDGGPSWFARVYIAGTPYGVAGLKSLSNNKWQLIGLQREGNTIRALQNGVILGELTNASAGGSLATSAPLRMGRDARAGTPNWFTGRLDDVRIYNYAITIEEFRNIYGIQRTKAVGKTTFSGHSSSRAITPLSVTDDSVLPQHMADADHGDITWLNNIATVKSLDSGTALPVAPQADDIFLVTDDSRPGACDSDAGIYTSLCHWNGSEWSGAGVHTLQEARVAGNVDSGATSAANAPTWGGAVARCRIYEDVTRGAIIECFDVASGNPLTFDSIIYNGDPRRVILHNTGNYDVCLSMDDTGLQTYSNIESCGTIAGPVTFTAPQTTVQRLRVDDKCLDTSAGKIFHDTDCDGVKDAGEEFIDLTGGASTDTIAMLFSCLHNSGNFGAQSLRSLPIPASTNCSSTGANTAIEFVRDAPFTGTVNTLICRIETAPGAGQSVVLTALVNGVASNASCTISDTSTGPCFDNTANTSVTIGNAIGVDQDVSASAVNIGRISCTVLLAR